MSKELKMFLVLIASLFGVLLLLGGAAYVLRNREFEEEEELEESLLLDLELPPLPLEINR